MRDSYGMADYVRDVRKDLPGATPEVVAAEVLRRFRSDVDPEFDAHAQVALVKDSVLALARGFAEADKARAVVTPNEDLLLLVAAVRDLADSYRDHPRSLGGQQELLAEVQPKRRRELREALRALFDDLELIGIREAIAELDPHDPSEPPGDDS